MLEVCKIFAGYGKPLKRNEILKDISFQLDAGSFLCILGANGCGKTTLLKVILGLLKPFSGSILVDGHDIRRMTEKENAQLLAYIPQAHVPPFPFLVRDVVLMGRTPYLTGLSSPSSRDEANADLAMAQMQIQHLADKSYTELSGGQRQMVLIARALAQSPRVLVMDEPTASLDFGNQYRVLEQVAALRSSGMSVLMVTHDPDHALFCADQAILMEKGRIIAAGVPGDVITEKSMRRLYDTPVRLSRFTFEDGQSRSFCVPVPGSGQSGFYPTVSS